MASSEEQSGQNYAKWSTEKLQERLEKLESQLATWSQTRRSDEKIDPGVFSGERVEIATELLRRGKLPAGSEASMQDAQNKFARLVREEHKKVKVPAPVRPVSTVSGLWLRHDSSKPTEVPAHPPVYFPSDLWPQTNVILLRAQRKFPTQTETLKLCKHVVAAMTPMLVEAVRTGKMEAGAVQREYGGGMEDVLHSLLVCNDNGIKSGFSSLSDEAYRLGQEVRKSEEWLALAEAITSSAADPAKTDENQAEPSRAQNSDRTAQTVEGKPTTAATDIRTRIGRNIDKLRKECGWSLDKLAEKTGIDKKAILSHLHGKSKPNPKTQKEYAQAFANELNRPITANDLEE